MEILRALGALIEPPESGQTAERLRLARLLDLADSDRDLPPAEVYTDFFLFQLYPYASVYLGPEGMVGGEARDRVVGFLRALGATPPAEPDHLAFLLAAYADLATSQDDDLYDPRRTTARQALLWEHLLSWIPAWLHALRRLEPPAFYIRWADLLDASLRRELALLGMPEDLPLHLRQASPLPDPDSEGAEAFLQSLLAPARSGIILLRDDLRRAAETLGLGLRTGERRYVVEHLLGQDPEAFLAWLGREADAWSDFWTDQAWLGCVAGWWRDRAATTARRLKRDAAAT